MNKLTKYIFKLFRVPPIKLNEVFTPTVAAELNYVVRPSIDSLLSSEMSIPGKQIIVYGHSGSGKTSSVRNMLNKLVIDSSKLIVKVVQPMSKSCCLHLIALICLS